MGEEPESISPPQQLRLRSLGETPEWVFALAQLVVGQELIGTHEIPIFGLEHPRHLKRRVLVGHIANQLALGQKHRASIIAHAQQGGQAHLERRLIVWIGQLRANRCGIEGRQLHLVQRIGSSSIGLRGGKEIDFGDLGTQYSIQPMKDNYGDLGTQYSIQPMKDN